MLREYQPLVVLARKRAEIGITRPISINNFVLVHRNARAGSRRDAGRSD
jgi:hypothetical protein